MFSYTTTNRINLKQRPISLKRYVTTLGQTVTSILEPFRWRLYKTRRFEVRRVIRFQGLCGGVFQGYSRGIPGGYYKGITRGY